MATNLLQKISFKQIIALIVLSIVVILFQNFISYTFNFIIHAYNIIINWLGRIFSNGYSGQLIEKTLALLLVPSLAALAISGVYWAFKRTPTPYTMPIIWVFWLILVAITNIKGML